MARFIAILPEKIAKAKELYEGTSLPVADIALMLGVSQTTFLNLVKLWEWKPRKARLADYDAAVKAGFDLDEISKAVADVDHLYINGADPEGDSTKLAVRSNDILFDAVTAAAFGTGDVRLQLSKEGSADTASVFFSQDFDGRAEFGLVGSDDFRLKVSADGDTWVTSLIVNPADGIVSLPLG